MMKRTKVFIATAIGLCLLLAVTGCGKTVLALDMDPNGKSCNVTADASEGDFAMSGALEVSKGEELHIDFDIEGDGTLSIQFISSSDMGLDEGEDADLEKLEEPEAEATLDVTVEGSDSDSYEIAPGTYYVYVTAESKVKGTAKVTVE